MILGVAEVPRPVGGDSYPYEIILPFTIPKEINLLANVYSFSDGCEEKNLLGNKGANLVTMTKLGLPVPPGFIVSIDAYYYYKKTGELPENEIERLLSALEEKAHQKLEEGLQVSVRSSGPVSMPVRST